MTISRQEYMRGGYVRMTDMPKPEAPRKAEPAPKPGGTPLAEAFSGRMLDALQSGFEAGLLAAPTVEALVAAGVDALTQIEGIGPRTATGLIERGTRVLSGAAETPRR